MLFHWVFLDFFLIISAHSTHEHTDNSDKYVLSNYESCISYHRLLFWTHSRHIWTCKFFSIAMSPYIWTYDICTLVDSLLFDIYHYYYFKHWRRATWAGCCFHSIVTFSSYSIFLLIVFPFVFFEILTTWLIAKYLNITILCLFS